MQLVGGGSDGSGGGGVSVGEDGELICRDFCLLIVTASKDPANSNLVEARIFEDLEAGNTP